MESYHHVFLVGIKGVAMANLAIFLKQMGKEVTGSDVEQTFITDHELKKHRITVINEFTPKSSSDTCPSLRNNGDESGSTHQTTGRYI